MIQKHITLIRAKNKHFTLHDVVVVVSLLFTIIYANIVYYLYILKIDKKTL